MSFLSHLKQERYSILLGLLTSALGFGIALYVNGRLEDVQSRRAYGAMMGAIVAEARSNELVTKHSFLGNYRQAQVVNDFSLSTVRAALASELFLEQVDERALRKLTRYIRHLELANGFAVATRQMRIAGHDASMLEEFMTPFGKAIDECQKSCEQIVKLSGDD